MDNPEKLAILGAQDKDKQTNNTAQYVLDTTTHRTKTKKATTTKTQSNIIVFL